MAPTPKSQSSLQRSTGVDAAWIQPTESKMLRPAVATK
jgi:hypothetical protein